MWEKGDRQLNLQAAKTLVRARDDEIGVSR